MAQVVSDHTIAGIIHVQVVRDPTQSDPQTAFSAVVNAPGITKTLPLNDNSTLDFPIKSGTLNGTIHVEVDDFTVLPHGATAANATAISCSIVFKLIEIVHITLGSVPVTAALK
jgi:hypothetical protein